MRTMSIFDERELKDWSLLVPHKRLLRPGPKDPMVLGALVNSKIQMIGIGFTPITSNGRNRYLDTKGPDGHLVTTNPDFPC